MNYKSYPNSKNTPSRKSRKGQRNATFIFNKYETRRLKKASRVQRESDGEREGSEG